MMNDETVAEIWKPIVGYETAYSVSSLGRGRGELRRNRYMPGKILKIRNRPDGYQEVELCFGGTQLAFKVHSLVAAAFIGARPDGYQVNHKDGVKSNNTPGNLEYLTRADNMEHSRRVLGNRHWGIGERHGNSKLTEEKVRQMRERSANGETNVSLSLDFGVSSGMVSMVINRLFWKHVS